MKKSKLHPAAMLVQTMNRIYHRGMTTTSGGNLSILDEDGHIWITPSGIDKGTLTPEAICCIRPDGTIVDRPGFLGYKPSVEWPFHATVYQRRPDLKAVLHAHPPMLVAFSVVRQIPDTNLVDSTARLLGSVNMAPYALPGSAELGDRVAGAFAAGYDLVMMENHGVVIGAADMPTAFLKFEAMEYAAHTQMLAKKLGTAKSLPADTCREAQAPEINNTLPALASTVEAEARRNLTAIIRRAYDQRLLCGAQGCFSARISEDAFLISPRDEDRANLDASDFICVQNGQIIGNAENNRLPDWDWALHKAIYNTNPDVNAIAAAAPPHVMAFAITHAALDSRTIPESYIMLRQVQQVPFATLQRDPLAVAEIISPKTPVLMIENSQIIATGNSLLQAFDRLEVAEATARNILAARALGALVPISDTEIRDIDVAFGL